MQGVQAHDNFKSISFWSSKPHRVFAKLDAGHPLVRLWLPLGRFPTGIQFPWLMLFVVLVSFFFSALWAFSEAGEMAVGSVLSFYFFGHAVDVREGPVK